jgi:hypothetical protein
VPSLTHSSTGSAYGAPARVSTATVFGRVLFLIAVALGFLAGGTIIGKDLSQGAALACSFGGLAMLLVASFGGRTFPGRRVRHWLAVRARPVDRRRARPGDRLLHRRAAGDPDPGGRRDSADSARPGSARLRALEGSLALDATRRVPRLRGGDRTDRHARRGSGRQPDPVADHLRAVCSSRSTSTTSASARTRTTSCGSRPAFSSRSSTSSSRC